MQVEKSLKTPATPLSIGQQPTLRFSCQQFLEYFETHDELEIPSNHSFRIHGLDSALTKQLENLIAQCKGPETLTLFLNHLEQLVLPIGKSMDVAFDGNTSLIVHPLERGVTWTTFSPIKISVAKSDLVTTVNNLCLQMIRTNRLSLNLEPNQSIYFTGITSEELKKLRSSKNLHVLLTFMQKEIPESCALYIRAVKNMEVCPTNFTRPLAIELVGDEGIQISIQL